MKFFFILIRLTFREIKLLSFYLFVWPFFIVKAFFKYDRKYHISIFNKFLLILFGEVWIFGKRKIDLREVYEFQRKSMAFQFSIKTLLEYTPGQWYTLSPLESSLFILMRPKNISAIQKVFYIPYIVYLLLFEESRHSIKSNHGIVRI